LEDDTDFGLLMIKEGYAYEYTYNIPYKYQQQYKNAQKEAQENKKGLWGDSVCSF
jgi:micrococcal nuclease